MVASLTVNLKQQRCAITSPMWNDNAVCLFPEKGNFDWPFNKLISYWLRSPIHVSLPINKYINIEGPFSLLQKTSFFFHVAYAVSINIEPS